MKSADAGVHRRAGSAYAQSWVVLLVQHLRLVVGPFDPQEVAKIERRSRVVVRVRNRVQLVVVGSRCILRRLLGRIRHPMVVDNRLDLLVVVDNLPWCCERL